MPAIGKCGHLRQGSPDGKEMLPCATPRCNEGAPVPSVWSRDKEGKQVELVRGQQQDGKFVWTIRYLEKSPGT